MSVPIVITPLNANAASRGMPLSLRAAFAFAARIEKGSLLVDLPDGRSFRFGGLAEGPQAHLRILDLKACRSFLLRGDVGIGEAYLRGEWDSADVTVFLELFATNSAMIQNLLDRSRLARVVLQLNHALRRNSKRGSKRNIAAHYDLGNSFYEAWLDETMTYSSAVFEPGDNDLSRAQMRKYRLLADRIGIRPGEHVLEIGCGWGGFAEFAARERDCRVTALTISRAQFDYAAERIARAGLNDRVEIRFSDYRDETGVYDRIASIEMFEAVGEAYWPVFFRQMHSRLRPGGTAGLQVITIEENFFENYRRSIDFIRRHVFPGGMLPSIERLTAAAQRAGFTPHLEMAFGADYSKTLALWRDRFLSAWPNLAPLGFDDRFRRLWHYYLSYCEAGFSAGTIDVRQVVFAKAG